MSTINVIDFTVKIDNLQQVKIIEKTFIEQLAPNQVLLEIDKFSFTSNNITYGVIGEKMNYWKFFPTQEGFGIIPAWGLANVVASDHPEVKVGQRFYGYFPMSTHLLVTVGNHTGGGFMDYSEHRRALPSVYNFYSNTQHDPSFTKETEDLIALFRPLFVTSFLIDDHLAEQNFYDASQIFITSASSKTALALASLLAQHKIDHRLNFKLVGLTSKRNVAFVTQMGWYDEIRSYDDIAQINAEEKSVVVDFTGNHSIQFQLQTILHDNLAYNCLVGLVDWQNLSGKEELPRKGELFFAPSYAAKRQKEWGAAAFSQKVGIAWHQFSTAVQPLISIEEYKGSEKLKELHLDMLKGNIDPQQGNIVSLTR